MKELIIKFRNEILIVGLILTNIITWNRIEQVSSITMKNTSSNLYQDTFLGVIYKRFDFKDYNGHFPFKEHWDKYYNN